MIKKDWREEVAEKFGWQDQDAVKRWVEKLRSANYATQCLSMLKLLVEETKKTPDQLINERIEQSTSKDPRIRSQAEDTVLRVHRKLAEETPGTAINFFRKMKSFYKHNYTPLGCTDPGYSVQREVKDRRVMEKLTKDKIREMCEQAQVQVRFGLLVLAESGARIGAVMSLTYENVKDDLESEITPATIWLKQASKKKGGTYPSFICGDAVKLLRLIIKSKKNLTDKTPIFSIGRGALQTFLKEFNSGIHAHLFRKRFQTILEEAGVPLNWVDRLMGHVPRGAQGGTYSLPSITKLREYYIKAVPELKIYGAAEVDDEELQRRIQEALNKNLAKILGSFIDKKALLKPVTEETIQEAIEQEMEQEGE